VKTRTGIREHVTEAWIEALLATDPAAITLHGRTQRAMSRLPADWEEIGKAVRIRDGVRKRASREGRALAGAGTLILGNGDVTSLAQGHELVRRHGVDGVMIGRGIFQDAWLFNDPPPVPGCDERLALLWRHTERFFAVWTEGRNFNNLKKFYKIYCSGFPGAAVLRAQLMEAESVADVRRLLPRNAGAGSKEDPAPGRESAIGG